MLRNLKQLQNKVIRPFALARPTDENQMDTAFRLISYASQGNVSAL